METDKHIPYLTEEQLSSLRITTHEVIGSIEALISRAESKTAWSAPKAVILPGDGRYMMAALAAADEPPLLAVKTVLLNPENPNRGLPPINGLVTMLDSSSGLPVAILDGNWITAVRTAALSAAAAKHMARKDSAVVAFLGCGVQARSHLQAFSDLFPLKEARLFGRGQANIDRLREEVLAHDPDYFEARLQQVFLNLTRNAMQAMEETGGKLTLSTRMTLSTDASAAASAATDSPLAAKTATWISAPEISVAQATHLAVE